MWIILLEIELNRGSESETTEWTGSKASKPVKSRTVIRSKKKNARNGQRRNLKNLVYRQWFWLTLNHELKFSINP